jgi:hypothetical protein
VSAGIIQALQQLLPAPAVLIGEVLQVHSDNTSTVEFPDGSQQRVRGTIVAVGQPAFIRNGIIEMVAPSRVAFVIDV